MFVGDKAKTMRTKNAKEAATGKTKKGFLIDMVYFVWDKTHAILRDSHNTMRERYKRRKTDEKQAVGGQAKRE